MNKTRKFHELIDKSSPIPAYQQIIDDMIDRINSEEWSMNARLPSEEDLAKEYIVSRTTIRQAMAELERRMIIARHQGKGAYLIGNIKPFVEDLNLPSLGAPRQKSASTVLELKPDPSPPNFVIAAFSDVNCSLIHLSRLFLKNNYAIGLNNAWFPSSLVPELDKKGLIDSSITITLRERYGYTIVRVDNSIEAVKANAREASLLGIPYDASLLKIQSSHYSKDNLLVQFSNTLWVGDLTRFRFSAT